MAKSFKEIGKKAEALIEQGKEADRKVQNCQARVASSNSRVAAARRQLAAASETDEEGNPVGDVEQARAQLSMAENQLAASQRALSSARGDADRVKAQKNAHVQEIEQHNRVERSNLDKLRRLRSGAFSSDSVALTEGIAQRLNEAEDARVALLRSMGIDATPDHVSVGGDGSADSGWRGGGFATLDTTGQARSYHGGGSEGVTSSGGVAAPVGGGLASSGVTNESNGMMSQDPLTSQNDAYASTTSSHESSNRNNLGSQDLDSILNDSNLSTNEKIDALRKRKAELLAMNQHNINSSGMQAEKSLVRTLKLSDQQRYQMGLDYIDNIIDDYRYNLHQRGIGDGEAMERTLAEIRAEYLKTLSNDIQDGTIALYDLPNPDFDILEKKIRSEQTVYQPKYVINDKQRESIREGIRKGIVTEKDIRSIGQNVREKYDQLVLEKHREYDEIRNEQFSLALELKNAKTNEEKKRIEYRRKVLMEREKNLSDKYNSSEMMKSILSQYREVGPDPNMKKQPYKRSIFNSGSGKVIKAIDNVRDYIPTDWVKKSNKKPISAKHVPRGYFFPGATSDTVALSGDKHHMESCAFHEMGHRFEHMYPEILTIEKQFYDRRTNGEELSWLGPGYARTEVTRFDNFISPYMGKDYGGSGYELLSMGMEGVFCETYNISRDTEYENLILGILATI